MRGESMQDIRETWQYFGSNKDQGWQQKQKGRRFRRPFCFESYGMDSCSPALLHNRDYAEGSGEVIVGAGGEEQLVDGAILASAVAKFKSPELVDADFGAFGVFQFADIFPGYGVEGVNASDVGVVANDQGVTELAEILGSDGQAPGLVQRRTLGQAL